MRPERLVVKVQPGLKEVRQQVVGYLYRSDPTIAD
jgi:hypothetical protein